MPLLPYDTLLIDSPLPVEQAAARLQRATGPRKWLRTWGLLSVPSHPFVGKITGHRVSIQRVTRAVPIMAAPPSAIPSGSAARRPSSRGA